ncbi:hypothetical protein HQ585_16595 [candidate division KSB1 bacterium]|nr:hypothetical protein [candidate division KSB1 bacterium]
MNRESNRIPQPLLKQTLLLIFLVCLILSTQVQAGHGLAPALSLMRINSTDGDRVALLSPGLNYSADFRIKKPHFIISTTIVLPLWATQNGKRYTNPNFYDFYLGTDLFLGIALDYDVQDHFRLSPAVGYHLNGILMRGKPRYLDFYSLTSGIGLHVLATDRRDSRLLNYLFLSLGIDFLDFLYEENRLRTGISLCLGVGHRF